MKRFILLIFCAITTLNVMAQNGRKVEGIVADENGRPLPNATVKAVGDAAGVNCDANGNFVLYVDYSCRSIIANCDGYYPSVYELDGMMVVIRLKVDPEYKIRKAQEEERARIAAAQAAAAKAKAEEEARIAAEREAAAKAKAEEQARIAAEKAAAAEAAAKAKAEEQARIAAEKAAAAEAAAKAKAEEEARKAAEHEAAAKAKAEEEARKAAEREAAAKAKAEEQARIAAEKAAEREAAAKAKAEEDARIAAEKAAAAEAAAKAKAEKKARMAAERETLRDHKLQSRVNDWNYAPIGGYTSIVDLSMSVMHNYRVGVSYIGGYGFNKGMFIGAGVGVDMALNQGDVMLGLGDSVALPRGDFAFPAFLYFRYNILQKWVSPYVAIAAGGHFSLSREAQLNQYSFTIPGVNMMINPQVGATFSIARKLNLNVGVGLNVYSTTYCLRAWSSGACLQRKLQCAMDIHVGIMF